jgi:hypothetical protein
MKTSQHIQKQKQDSTETEQLGMTLPPPQFKLVASTNPQPSAQEHSNDDKEASAMEGGYEERVSNFATLTAKVVVAASKKSVTQLLVALESLKSDSKEFAQFSAYFQGIKHVALADYLSSEFGEGNAKAILTNLTVDPKTLSMSNVAMLVQESIAEKDANSALALLLGFDNSEYASKIYHEQYPDKDLRTDILSIGSGSPEVVEFVGNFFGDRQNYERVKVTGEAEAAEARALIARIFDVYGVDVNSQKALDMTRERYPDTPKEILDKLHTSAWRLSDLRDLATALASYAPISGPNRATSSRRGEKDQEVSSIGRVNMGLSQKDGQFELGNLSGRYYPGRNLAAIYDPAMDKNNSGRTVKSKDAQGKSHVTPVKDSMLMVIAHEIGHGFLEYAANDFAKAMPYWKKEDGIGLKKRKVSFDSMTYFDTDVANQSVEAPPTLYGAENHIEDLAESLMLYFHDNRRLRGGSEFYRKLSPDSQQRDVVGAPCPERMQFIQREIAKWKLTSPTSQK